MFSITFVQVCGIYRTIHTRRKGVALLFTKFKNIMDMLIFRMRVSYAAYIKMKRKYKSR